MCTLFANLYVLLTWGPHMVDMGTPYLFDIYVIRCGWLGQLSTPPAKQQAPLTTRSSGLWCVSAAEHHTAEQYSKTGKTKPQKHLPMSNLSWNTRQDFLKIPSLWESALETERRCFSKVNLESNVTPNISRSSDSFSRTVNG